MLMKRDFEAFLAADWSMIEPDFLADEFCGIDGDKLPDPDHWHLRFPDLGSYRTEWLAQAAAFQKIELVGVNKHDFLYQSSVLREVEITGSRAMARKKFNGLALTTTGSNVQLKWQTLYFLRRFGTEWKITGFVGYLPNPTPKSSPALEPVTGIDGLPVPRGPFAHGVKASGHFLFVSGQGPYDPALGQFIRGNIAEQTRLTLECVDRVLCQTGTTRDRVISCRVYLQPINKETYAEMNAVYQKFFGTHKPARTTIGSQLLDIDVEIDCVALLR